MKVRFLAPAQDELREGVRFYNGQKRGLGADFRDEVRAAIRRIGEHPLAWHPISGHIRRYLLHRFPYGIIYQLLGDELLIIAVAHLHREPHYWRDRTER